MKGKKAKKNVNSPDSLTPQSAPLREQPAIDPPEKAKQGNPNGPSDDHHLPLDYHQATGLSHENFVNLACLVLSIWVVHACPLPEKDVQKRPGVSFLSLYFNGDLDQIANITQMLIAAAFSVFLDFFVVSFHVLYPPHPKFVLVTKRKVSIYLHLVSGITEIVTGVLAFVIADTDTQRMFTQIMSTASITHALTAYYQTGVVFGAKGIMVPGYIYAITLHVTNAYRLYQDPSSVVYLLFTFLLLHIYVWCRFFIYVFRVCKVFEGYHYTVAITLSGLLLFPFAVGPIGNFGMLFVVIAYCVLEAAFSRKTGRHLSEKLFREHERYALVSPKQLLDWREDMMKASDDDFNFDKKAAKSVYDSFHAEGREMTASDIYKMLQRLQIPSVSVKGILAIADRNESGTLSFSEFYRYVWSLGTVHDRILKLKNDHRLPIEMTHKDKARLVFDMIDLDDSGYIGLSELELLLSQWGMPYLETSDCIQQFARKEGHKLDFEEFYLHMRPVWDFAANEILS